MIVTMMVTKMMILLALDPPAAGAPPVGTGALAIGAAGGAPPICGACSGGLLIPAPLTLGPLMCGPLICGPLTPELLAVGPLMWGALI